MLVSQVVVIIAPPPSVAYPFILDLEGYPTQIINFAVVVVRILIWDAYIWLMFVKGPVLFALEEATPA